MHTLRTILGGLILALSAGCMDIPDYSALINSAMAGVAAANAPGANPVLGRVTVRPPGGEPQTYAMRYCRSGQGNSFSGVDLVTNGTGGATLRMVVDPIEGVRLRLQREGGTPVVLDAAHCTQLAGSVTPTGTAINRITLVQGSMGFDCTLADGTSYVGDAHYSSCHSSSQADEAIVAITDGARLQALPEIPESQPPAYLTDGLRGLRVYASARIAGTLLGEETPQTAHRACLGGVRALLQQIGWVTVSDPGAPHDLEVQMACTGSVMFRNIGERTEIDLPDAHGPSVLIQSAGQTVEEIAPTSRQWRCPLSGDTQAREHACAERLSHANDARIAGLIASSQRLHDWLSHRPTTQPGVSPVM